MDVPDENNHTVLPAIRQLVAGGPLPAAFTSADVSQALEYEVGELLLSVAEREAISIPPNDLLTLTALAMRTSRRADVAERALAEVADVADQTNCAFAVFKGPATASLLYDHPSERPFNDVDILVGYSGTEGLEDFLIALGRDQRSASALVELSQMGQPIHEVSIRVAGVDVDVHFNAFGLITPVRQPRTVEAEFANTFSIGDRTYATASPEMSLLISSVNLVRKGGGALWLIADLARLIHGRAGILDWDQFVSLAKAEGLWPLAAQALRLVNNELGVKVPLIARATGGKWWAPEIGEGAATKGVLRRSTFSILHQDPIEPWTAAQSLRRWYLPSSIHRTARSPVGSASISHQLQGAVESIGDYSRTLRN